MAEDPQEPKNVEPPRGMYPGKLDDRGRVKLPSVFQEYFSAIEEKKFFVTSLDRRIAQIYPMSLWKHNEKVFADFKEKPSIAKAVAFNAADLGAETEMDGSGRVLLSPELRRELAIENSAVRLFFYNGRVDVMSEKIYEERKSASAQLKEEDFERLEAAGLK